MALQGQIIFDNGIVLSSGYLRVLAVNMKYNVNDNSTDIRILIFKDKAAYDSGLPEVMDVSHTVSDGDFAAYFAESILDDAGKTGLTQAYVWLKTLPQYSSLTDV